MPPKASKRKTSSQPSPHKESKEEEVLSVAKASPKRAKRESMEEQRAKAREWAEQRAERKRALAAAAAASPVSGSATATTTVPTKSNIKKEISKNSTLPSTVLPKAKTPVISTTYSTNLSSVPSQTSVLPPKEIESSSEHPRGTNQSVSVPDSLSKASSLTSHKSKLEELVEGKERARRWAELRKVDSHSAGSVVQPPEITRPSMEIAMKNPMSSVHGGEEIASQNIVQEDNFPVEKAKPPLLSSIGTSDSTKTFTRSTIIALQRNHATIAADRLVQQLDKVELKSQDDNNVEVDEVASLLLNKCLKTAAAESVDPDTNSQGYSTKKESYITYTAKQIRLVSHTFAAVLAVCVRVLVLSVTLGFFLYAWSFIYRDIATKLMYERSLSIFSNSSFLARHTSQMAGFCYFNDQQTQSSLPSSDISPSAAYGAECFSTEMISKKRVSCPEHGVCNGGVWQSCVPSDLWEKHEESRSCRLTDKAQKELEKAQQLLSHWTSNCLCGTVPRLLERSIQKDLCIRDWKGIGDGLTYFDLHDVAWQLVMMDKGVESSMVTSEEIEEKTKQLLVLFSLPAKLPLVLLLPSQKMPSYMVALSKEASSLVSLPYACWLRMWLFYFLGLIVSIVHLIVTQFFYYAVQYPLLFSVSFVTFLTLKKMYDTYNKRVKTRELVSQARTISYDKLIYESQQGSNTYAVLHLGEDVAQTFYPDNLKSRQDFLKRVWPRVVTELKNDVRIQQCQKAVGGVVLECWTWLGNKGSSLSTPASMKKRNGSNSHMGATL